MPLSDREPTDQRPAVHVRQDGLTVLNPAWAAMPSLIHGTTTRAAIPEAGKTDWFDALARARACGALPVMWTLGADQVHGAAVRIIDRPLQPHEQPPGYRTDAALAAGEYPATDGLVTTLPGVLLIVRTADCLPVFLLDRRRRICGLAHAGRRGLLGGIAGALVRAAIDAGARADELDVWLGPAICATHYEVGPELVEPFRAAWPEAPVSPDGRRLDLTAVARAQLVAAGVAPDRIAASGECTLEHPERYHSYRAHGEGAGRMFSFIGFVAEVDNDAQAD